MTDTGTRGGVKATKITEDNGRGGTEKACI